MVCPQHDGRTAPEPLGPKHRARESGGECARQANFCPVPSLAVTQQGRNERAQNALQRTAARCQICRCDAYPSAPPMVWRSRLMIDCPRATGVLPLTTRAEPSAGFLPEVIRALKSAAHAHGLPSGHAFHTVRAGSYPDRVKEDEIRNQTTLIRPGSGYVIGIRWGSRRALVNRTLTFVAENPIRCG